VDHVHAELRGDEVGDRVAIGEPERDMVELAGIHPVRLGHFLRSTARWSCCLFIDERPGMFIRFASLESCSCGPPRAPLVPELLPPRRPDDMSVRESRE